MSTSQRKSSSRRSQRRVASDFVRIEVKAPATDAPILRDIAARLRKPTPEADDFRDRLREIVSPQGGGAAADIFASDLPDTYFEGVFEEGPRTDLPRDVDL